MTVSRYAFEPQEKEKKKKKVFTFLCEQKALEKNENILDQIDEMYLQF